MLLDFKKYNTTIKKEYINIKLKKKESRKFLIKKSNLGGGGDNTEFEKNKTDLISS